MKLSDIEKRLIALGKKEYALRVSKFIEDNVNGSHNRTGFDVLSCLNTWNQKEKLK